MLEVFSKRKEDIPESDIRNYSRIELLEILIKLSEENDELVEENRRLKEALESRAIAIAEAGNIAQAALAINKVFEAAQAAADAYLLNIKQGASYVPNQQESLYKTAALDLVHSELSDFHSTEDKGNEGVRASNHNLSTLNYTAQTNAHEDQDPVYDSPHIQAQLKTAQSDIARQENSYRVLAQEFKERLRTYSKTLGAEHTPLSSQITSELSSVAANVISKNQSSLTNVEG